MQIALGHSNEVFAFAQRRDRLAYCVGHIRLRYIKCLRAKYFCAAARRRRWRSPQPAQKSITRYLDATGNTAPIKTVDLVARVQGFLQAINYKDGSSVKEGTTLFTIEPEDLQGSSSNRRRPAESGLPGLAETRTETDYKGVRSIWYRGRLCRKRRLDTSTPNRRQCAGNLKQAQANTKIAQVNYRLQPMSPRRLTAS